jgi:hypothetical protein
MTDTMTSQIIDLSSWDTQYNVEGQPSASGRTCRGVWIHIFSNSPVIGNHTSTDQATQLAKECLRKKNLYFLDKSLTRKLFGRPTTDPRVHWVASAAENISSVVRMCSLRWLSTTWNKMVGWNVIQDGGLKLQQPVQVSDARSFQLAPRYQFPISM